jgi:hypothetical protein
MQIIASAADRGRSGVSINALQQHMLLACWCCSEFVAPISAAAAAAAAALLLRDSLDKEASLLHVQQLINQVILTTL